jgi:hypothetical protein
VAVGVTVSEGKSVGETRIIVEVPSSIVKVEVSSKVAVVIERGVKANAMVGKLPGRDATGVGEPRASLQAEQPAIELIRSKMPTRANSKNLSRDDKRKSSIQIIILIELAYNRGVLNRSKTVLYPNCLCEDIPYAQ